uniref:Uncharacterized protein n=1 Tax=Lygus hesperus TaxID=30085 RepID=A0A0A9X2K9_LYGHE
MNILKGGASTTTLLEYTSREVRNKKANGCGQGKLQKLSEDAVFHYKTKSEFMTEIKCRCIFNSGYQLLKDWELYHPRTKYIKSNRHSKPSSTDVLRQILTDGGSTSKQIGRPTALSRLVVMMQKHQPPPLYKYGNCLQQTLNFDERNMKYEFIDRIIYKEPDIDEIYLHKKPVLLSRRKNPFAAVQLCPTSMFQLQNQPPGQEYVSRKDLLLDPQSLGLDVV